MFLIIEHSGTDTTANGLVFPLGMMAKYPDIQDKVVEEIHSVLQGRSPRSEDLSKLAFMTCVIQETQRLYSPIPLVARAPAEDVTVMGHVIKANTTCVIPIWPIHYSPDVWPDPLKFDPSRFRPGTYYNFYLIDHNCRKCSQTAQGSLDSIFCWQ